MDTATGSYTGDGNDNRSIGGVGFQPALVIIVRVSNGAWSWRSSAMSGDVSLEMSGVTVLTDRIQALEADGFQLGTSIHVNAAGAAYKYVAFGADSTMLDVGTYTGNGADNRDISIGLTPSFVYTQEDGSVGGGLQGIFRVASISGDNSFRIANTAGYAANHIQAFGANSFQVGTGGFTNLNTQPYYYFAFADGAQTAYGSYVGNNTDNRDIVSSPAIEPVWMILKRHASANLRLTVMRLASHSGDVANIIGTGEQSDIIQAFNTNGFEVGADYYANGNDGGGDAVNTYFWYAVAASPITPLSALPEVEGGGAGGILPFAPYQQLKAIRESMKVFNNLVLGP